MPSNHASRQSLFGLNAVNFFLAEVAGVIAPFLSDFLRQHGWRYDHVGLVIGMGGLGTLLMQTPAGLVIDRMRSRRALLGFTSLLLGISYGVLPALVQLPWAVGAVSFVAGCASAFFAPLLGALALALVGHTRLSETIGVNQSYNHAGNIASAMLALVLIHALGIAWIFYVTLLISALASASLVFIRKGELNEDLSRVDSEVDSVQLRAKIGEESPSVLANLLRDSRVRILLASVLLFHLANAPVMPLVALYLKHLGGTDEKVAWVVLVAQVVMVPVAWLAGKYCPRFGRKPIFSAAFLVLPVRILLYSFTRSPNVLLAIQSLDGIGAGIYGVVIALICSDLTRGKPGFTTLMGVAATAQALGAFLGPLLQGVITEHLGFPEAFIAFATIAAVGAIVFLVKMPETQQKVYISHMAA